MFHLCTNKSAFPLLRGLCFKVPYTIARWDTSSTLRHNKIVSSEAYFLLCVDIMDLTQFVNPLIGTAGGGHVFAGASVPFGMAKIVPDIDGV